MVFFLKPASEINTDTIVQTQQNHVGQKSILSQTLPTILKINIHGMIGGDNLTAESINSKLFNVHKHFPNPDLIKGIILHVDTPGGTVTDSFEIYRALKSFKNKYKVPIYAYIDGTCASGGIYVTSSTDKIYASPVSLVGSVGVVCGASFNLLKLLNTHGIEVRSISKGKDKMMLSPLSNWEQNSDQSLDIVAGHLYEHFVNLVVSTRPKINREELVNKYGAQVYIASEAETIGFIDHGNSSYYETLGDLVTKCGLEHGSKYQVVSIETKRSILMEMFGQPSMPSLPIMKWFGMASASSTYPFQFLYKP